MSENEKKIAKMEVTQENHAQQLSAQQQEIDAIRIALGGIVRELERIRWGIYGAIVAILVKSMGLLSLLDVFK